MAKASPTASKKKTTKKSSEKPTKKIEVNETFLGRKITVLVLTILGVISAIGYFQTDAILVTALKSFIKALIGWGFYIAPVAFILAAVLLFIRLEKPHAIGRTVCLLLIPVIFGCFVHLFTVEDSALYKGLVGELWKTGKELTSGGALAGSITALLVYLISRAGTFIVLFLLLAVFVLVSSNIKFRSVVNKVKAGAENGEGRAKERRAKPEKSPKEDTMQIAPEPFEEKAPPKPAPRFVYDIPIDDPIMPPEQSDKKTKKSKKEEPSEQMTMDDIPPWEEQAEHIPKMAMNAREIVFSELPDNVAAELITEEKSEPKKSRKKQAVPEELFEVPPEQPVSDGESYSFPPLDILPSPQGAAGIGEGSTEARINTERLESAFRSFGINLAITGYTRGPTVTRYEASLEAGTKLSKLTNLEDDIALALGSTGVRIAAMPNKIATVGIEVPNKVNGKVLLREIIDSNEFKSSGSKLTFAIGKNISGDAIVGNIAKLPHLLVAGTTGSGKSVCLNSLILSILYKARPDEVKFIMIDPKMVEFKIYSGIPHLLVPVVTEPKKAAGALQWAVVEMLKRYRYFADENARDLESYNAIMRSREDGTPMYQLVVVIDELADLMMMAAKEVEESICRIAQMGRAAGIHLVIATQSPRADVITGLMKANIPSRIALKVSSSLESRIILDAGGGAEKLLGNGDMLYMPIGSSKPLRVQGTWVSDEERENVIEYIKAQAQAEYSEDVINEIEKAAIEKGKAKGAKPDEEEESHPEFDELLPQAVDVTFEVGQASTSMLQRKLKLGYSRAARIVDQMEELGIIGPFEGSKPRQLLITRQQWQEMQFINGTAPIEEIPEYTEEESTCE